MLGDSQKEVYKIFHKQLKELKQHWMKEGFKDSSIQQCTIEFRMMDLEYRSEKRRHKYAINCPFVLTIDNVDDAPAVQEKTMSLVEKGYTFSNQSLNYQYTNVANLQKDMEKEALLNGQKSALESAKELGITLGSAPERVGCSTLSACSVADNPSPYEKNWGFLNNLYNKFVVLVKMSYNILNPDLSPESKKARVPAKQENSQSNQVNLDFDSAEHPAA